MSELLVKAGRILKSIGYAGRGDFALEHTWNFIIGYVSGDAVNFHFDRYMWYLFAENEVFVGERRDESLSKIVILNKTNNDCIFL